MVVFNSSVMSSQLCSQVATLDTPFKKFKKSTK